MAGKTSLVWSENYEKVCAGYAEVAKMISKFETVTLIVSEDTIAEAKALVESQLSI